MSAEAVTLQVADDSSLTIPAELLQTLQVSPQQTIKVAVHSARYRHGLGLPTVDSLILATFLINECQEMLSTDNHFHIIDKQKILPVEFLL